MFYYNKITHYQISFLTWNFLKNDYISYQIKFQINLNLIRIYKIKKTALNQLQTHVNRILVMFLYFC